jgi:hypothetical protein
VPNLMPWWMVVEVCSHYLFLWSTKVTGLFIYRECKSVFLLLLLHECAGGVKKRGNLMIQMFYNHTNTDTKHQNFSLLAESTTRSVCVESSFVSSVSVVLWVWSYHPRICAVFLSPFYLFWAHFQFLPLK